jgi:hypothetical protein
MSATVLQTRPLGDGLGVEIGGVDLKRVGDTPIAGFIDCHDRASALLIWGNRRRCAGGTRSMHRPGG